MVYAEVEVPTWIAGGFVLVPVAELVAAWRACRSAPLGVGDFRAWLAIREMVARRCLTTEGRSVTYDYPELAKLLGVREKRARSSVRRLELAGLIEWSDSAIGFPAQIPDVHGPVADSIGRGQGSVAIPRRILRHLADGARPALIATTLGLLLRCLSRRKGGFDGRGRLKAAWIARSFAVDLRRVKQARKELVALGWIEPQTTNQRAENRWGRVFRIDLTWGAPQFGHGEVIVGTDKTPIIRPGATLPPLSAVQRPEIATPSVDQEPLSERENNQEPTPTADPDGASLGEGGGREPEPEAPQPGRPTSTNSVATPPMVSPTEPIRLIPPAPATTIPGVGMSAPLPAPRLEDVRVEDLKDTTRLLDLNRQAIAKGLVTASEADRLRFVGAAAHALAIGKANPAGLFAWLVRGRRWGYLTQGDEDAASRRLKAHERPASIVGVPQPRTAGDGLSDDARLVREVRVATIRAGIFRDPFPSLQARDGRWTRERWDRALGELGLI